MFDHHHFHQHKAPVTNVKIEQQPNDAADAARLYGECEAKAQAAVANATVDTLGANNSLVVVRCESWRTMIDDSQKVRIIFKLNGELHDMELPVDRWAMIDRCYDVVGRKLLESIAKVLNPRPALSGGGES